MKNLKALRIMLMINKVQKAIQFKQTIKVVEKFHLIVYQKIDHIQIV